jgi:hypothetical protein
MSTDPAPRDRWLGFACVIACPLISGAFLALIAVLCGHSSGTGHVIATAARVGFAAFAANLLVIVIAAVANEARHVRTYGVSR